MRPQELSEARPLENCAGKVKMRPLESVGWNTRTSGSEEKSADVCT